MQTDIIRILLRNGAQVDARAREQQTPLHIASRLGNVDIVMLLLQHGAKVDTTTKDMYTALHIAAKEGQDEVRLILLNRLVTYIDIINTLDLFWLHYKEVLIYILFLFYNDKIYKTFWHRINLAQLIVTFVSHFGCL